MLFRKIDPETGLWLEDVIFEAQPMTDNDNPDPSYISVPCPEGFYLPRWDGERWVEGKTPKEIAAVKAGTQPLTPAEQWRTDIENAMVELAGMLAGGE